MDTITKGRIGYNLFEYQMLIRDWDLYTPVLENTKVDCIAIKNNQLFKFQIKTLIKSGNSKALPVRKISHNQGEYKIHLYNEQEIDFFIGVDTDELDLYIVPIEFIKKYSNSISIRTLQPYKNNFSILEPCIGNSTSGDDDIGERLTANTEGMQ